MKPSVFYANRSKEAVILVGLFVGLKFNPWTYVKDRCFLKPAFAAHICTFYTNN
jgi:hypothetical protein